MDNNGDVMVKQSNVETSTAKSSWWPVSMISSAVGALNKSYQYFKSPGLGQRVV